MTNSEKEQVKELCNRAILSLMCTDKVIETFENNEWAEFTLGEGNFTVQLKFYNRGFKKWLPVGELEY